MVCAAVGAVLIFLFVHDVPAQTPVDVEELVRTLKSDSRGPFQSIAWFCPDGTVLPASQRCPEPGGIQHGLHRDVIKEVEGQGIYLGQLLTGLDRSVFLDKAAGFSRARQYQLEVFLQRVDDGWIMRHARHYRGAIHAADEEAWGAEFLGWLLADDAFVESHFFWARELARDIPHAEDEDRSTRIRTLSERLANGMPDFLPISVKIHGRPDSTDLASVNGFHDQHRSGLPEAAREILVGLETDLAAMYEPVTLDKLAARYQARLDNNSAIFRELQLFATAPGDSAATTCTALSSLLGSVRARIAAPGTAGARLALFDLSWALEDLLVETNSTWQPVTIVELLEKSAVLAAAAAGCGYITPDEWVGLAGTMDTATLSETETLGRLGRWVAAGRQSIDSSVSVLDATYADVVDVFAEFEPLMSGFYDDRIGNSTLWPLGDNMGRLAKQIASRADIAHAVVDVVDAGTIRGLNAGVAVGELVVVHGRADNFQFEPDKIYVLQQAPSTLKPVAGLMSVNDGNPVSNVQRLSSRLAIPNAAIGAEHQQALTAHSGRLMFYAVSPGGRVVLKSTWDMTEVERGLFATESPSDASAYLRGLDSDLDENVKIGLHEMLSDQHSK